MHVAGRARAGFLARMLDLDALLEQVVEQRLAGLALERLAFGAELRHAAGRRSRASATYIRACRCACPVSARATPRSMRRAANSSVARLSASTAARSADVIAARALPRRSASAASIAARSAGVEQLAVGRERGCASRRRSGRPRPALRPARAPACRRPRARTSPAASARSRRRHSPYDGLTAIDASTPVVCSRADTDSRPSASTWNVT